MHYLLVVACKQIMADNMEVPPLEDMSSVLEKVLDRRDIKTDGGSSNRTPVVASSGSTICDRSTNGGKNTSSVCVIR